jgi:hypothetical protein
MNGKDRRTASREMHSGEGPRGAGKSRLGVRTEPLEEIGQEAQDMTGAFTLPTVTPSQRPVSSVGWAIAFVVGATIWAVLIYALA